MKITFLGTGTSHGIPAIGCTCAVCTSSDPRNRRRRSSLYVEAGGLHIVIDTPPDFREQVLAYGVRRVDAVLITHAHADHIFGFDDLRRFCHIQDMTIPVYGSAETLESLRRKFEYVHEKGPWSKSVPRVEHVEAAAPFSVGSVEVEPLAVPHGGVSTCGYRLRCGTRSLAYMPDCADVPAAVEERVRGVDVMILDALRRRPHPTHLHLEKSIEILKRIGARASYVTHLCHDLDHEETQREMPAHCFVPYDGQEVTW